MLPFNKNDKKDVILLKDLKRVAKIAGIQINKTGIMRARPNEVGNDVEPFVKKALLSIGYEAYTPRTIKSKQKKTMGYPDIEFIDKFNRTSYLECKTFNIQNINTTQRSFYLSPSEDFKVTKDAHHLIISYEIYIAGKIGKKNVFKCKSWKILNIEKLLVDVKYEFNTHNRQLYSKALILADGKL
ncbi:hypothetical protein A2661_02665 [Candidatus Giovannonibacteria bacterium RIFCSPHIGHO2_01_FULL_45_24]|uniref:Restriction endonuclease n=1 Tax=Candidatus Giovannonibacteria bacterium RIFCSPLOWO2_01_FULL_46_32 TaxID=1798353 RepID=A0A1F5XHZ9_9BACT|nr:MAG: hypothetical protein A2661_02665 [Candidatus Giovannonibacteria bacterium RIFCSPHIGHO2_01_FULL_45_24]OGF87111.1 MAG: hypothetical protein A3B19_00585 [Candidatus Giovannonibacteria bacterium RIFCSPLOWO2_01_FULL_46_32]